MAVLSKVIPLPAAYHPETLRAASASYLGTPARAEKELGWHARSLEEGLADTVAISRADGPSPLRHSTH